MVYAGGDKKDEHIYRLKSQDENDPQILIMCENNDNGWTVFALADDFPIISEHVVATFRERNTVVDLKYEDQKTETYQVDGDYQLTAKSKRLKAANRNSEPLLPANVF